LALSQNTGYEWWKNRLYPQPVAFGILASPVRQLFICSDCFHFNNVSKQYVQSFYTCSSQNKTHLRYKVPIFKTPQLNHLIFTQNCQNYIFFWPYLKIQDMNGGKIGRSDHYHWKRGKKKIYHKSRYFGSQNKTHLRYKVPIFKTPQLNHLIFTQNCQNILIYGISFSSLFFSDNGQTCLFFHHSYPVFWDRAKKKYMSVYEKLFPVTSWKIIGINFFILRPQQFFWGIITPSDRRAIKYILKVWYLFRIRVGPQSGISVC
jgi:hypothetical protein